MKKINVILAFGLIGLTTACGGNYKDIPTPGATLAQLGSQQIFLLGDASGLQLSPGLVRGTGAVLFANQLAESRAGVSYALNFSLPRDGASFTLVSHANSSLENGFEIEFARNGSLPGSLKVTLRAQGQTRDTVNSSGHDVFSGFDAAAPFQLQIDIHNNESPAHVMIWSRATGGDFSEALAILDTGDEIDKSHGSPGIGEGTRWGVRLKNAELNAAEPSSPKFVE